MSSAVVDNVKILVDLYVNRGNDEPNERIRGRAVVEYVVNGILDGCNSGVPIRLGCSITGNVDKICVSTGVNSSAMTERK